MRRPEKGATATIDLTRRTVALCVSGTRAELERNVEDARKIYREAWDCSTDDYDKCIAAHYIGHLESDPAEALRWHLLALARAQCAEPALVAHFLPSLYVNLGRAYELTGQASQSSHFYRLSADLGLIHQPD
jgi:hypothetical protein